MFRGLKNVPKSMGAMKIPSPALVLQDVQNEEAENPAKALGQVAQLPIGEEHQVELKPEECA
jgi:hypothetical protein